MINSINGMQIIFSSAALTETDVRLFPESKHRSERIRKKLIKRFGGEFVKEAAMYKVGDKIIAHPSFRSQILKVLNP